jgi:hypothetical protein
MRTTLNFDDALFRLAKQRAVQEGVTLTNLLEAALRAYMQAPPQQSKPFRLRIKVNRSEPVPGVDFSDRDSLYERMEGRI